MVEGQTFVKGDILTDRAYIDCVFEKLDLTEADLSGIRFSNCTFARCNLTATHVVGTRFQTVHLIESKCMGIDFFKCDPQFLRLDFEKCLLNGCNFSELPIKGSRFATSRVIDCHFSESNMERTSFFQTDLQGTIFHHTNLKQCDFTGATQFSIDPLSNELKGAKFSSVEALSLLKGLGIVLVD